MMETPTQREDALVEKYHIIEDPQERLQVLCSRKPRVTRLPEEACREELLVQGCSSPVWLEGGVSEGILHLRLHSPTPLVGALAGLLCDLADGQPAAEVRDFTPTWAARLGVLRFLSETRQRGLAAVWQRIRLLAGAETAAPEGFPPEGSLDQAQKSSV